MLVNKKSERRIGKKVREELLSIEKALFNDMLSMIDWIFTQSGDSFKMRESLIRSFVKIISDPMSQFDKKTQFYARLYRFSVETLYFYIKFKIYKYQTSLGRLKRTLSSIREYIDTDFEISDMENCYISEDILGEYQGILGVIRVSFKEIGNLIGRENFIELMRIMYGDGGKA